MEAAFRETPRDLFLPGVPLDQAYADSSVYTKQDASGENISAASEPGMVAAMLDQLGAQPGERVMEAGAGTGYNAAIVGEAGHVTTIDVDEDLVEGAREHLAAAGVGNVGAILGDGILGHPQGAPFHRIIAPLARMRFRPCGWTSSPQWTPGRAASPARHQLPEHRLRTRQRRMAQPRQPARCRCAASETTPAATSP